MRISLSEEAAKMEGSRFGSWLSAFKISGLHPRLHIMSVSDQGATAYALVRSLFLVL